MTSRSTVAIGSVFALALAAAPVSPAYASGWHHGGYGHGGHGGYGCCYVFNPLVGLATAVVGVAAAIVTAPIAILAAAAQAPYYGPGPGYPGAPVGYGGPPPVQGYYGAPPVAPYYAPPGAVAPGYSAAPAQAYYSPPPVRYVVAAQSRPYYGTYAGAEYAPQGRTDVRSYNAPRYAQAVPPDYRQPAPGNYGPPRTRTGGAPPPATGPNGEYQANYPPRTSDRAPPANVAYYDNGGYPTGANGSPPERSNYPR